MKQTVKVIDISAKEWFDRVNGNSYFSAHISIDGKYTARLPYQYGYGDHYIDMASQWLDENRIIDNKRNSNGSRTGLSYYCRENGIILVSYKQEKCLKREVIAWGKE